MRRVTGRAIGGKGHTECVWEDGEGQRKRSVGVIGRISEEGHRKNQWWSFGRISEDGHMTG